MLLTPEQQRQEDANYVEEETTIDNFLGNSLLGSVLNDCERKELFLKVQAYIQSEAQRTGYPITFKRGLVGFLMDPRNMSYFEKLERRDPRRNLIRCTCDTELDKRVQAPELNIAYRDHWYFMGLEKRAYVDEIEAVIDFNQHYIDKWAQLYRIVCDIAICPKGFNCERAERHVDKLLEEIGLLSSETWMHEVHGTDTYAREL